MSEVQTKLGALKPDSDLPELKNTLEFLAFIIRTVNSISDLDSVLRLLMDGAITLVGAERGFILLVGPKGKLQFRVARGVEQSDLSMDDFQVSRTLVRQVIAEAEPVLMDNASAQVGSVSAIGFNLLSLIAAPLRVEDKVVGVVYLDNPFKKGVFSDHDLELIAALADQAAVAIRRAALQEGQVRLKGFLDRYVSPQVAEALVKNLGSPTLQAKSAEVTILFADITGFTPLAEKLSPAEVLKMLNQHFTKGVDAVFHHRGTVKQFAGDEIMAIFGAPVAFEDHVERGVGAAISMLKAHQSWQDQRAAQGLPTFGLKIGLHSGHVVVGSVGSADRMEYAAVGDVVNTTARIMNLSSRYGLQNCVLASDVVAQKTEGLAQAKLMGSEQVKGREAEVSVYSLTS
jgi:adenylate cyclase